MFAVCHSGLTVFLMPVLQQCNIDEKYLWSYILIEYNACRDNAVAESLFGQMKNEPDRKIFENQEDAKCEIFDYIEVFYNRKTGHGYLGYLSPEEFETEKVA